MPKLAIDGVDIHYEQAGTGPGLVLVHGGLCDLSDWSHQLRGLASDHRVVAFDLRGHGKSAGDPAEFTIERLAADLNTVIDVLKLGPAVLVGHSLASRVVAEAAWQRPENTKRLILLDGSRSHGGFSASQGADETTPPMARSLTEILNLTIGSFANNEVRRHVLAIMSAASPELMAASVTAMREWDLTQADRVFAELTKPMLAIQCTYHDQFTPRRSLAANEPTPYLDFLRSVNSALEVAVLPGTGHFAMLERPDEVTELIRTFAADKKNVNENLLGD